MQCKRSWTISIAVLILLTAATRYVSAQVESRAASQTVGEDANDTVTFRVRIQNISPDDGVPTLFAPGAWVLHSKVNPLFKNGDADRGEGLESLAEDGNPAKLVETLRSKGLTAGSFNTPVCADTPGPLPSGNTVEFGDSYEFEVTTSPETPYLSFATMLVQSNDLFLAPSEKGIALFNENGTAVGVKNLTAELLLWDAGTEANEKLGVGPNQAPRQSDDNTGPADIVANVRPVDDGFSYPEISNLVRVYIVQVPMVERDRGREPVPIPDNSIGERFQVGDVQWRVLTAEYQSPKARNEGNDSLISDERFVLVRFEFLNLGSEPSEFDGGPKRKRKGVPLRDGQDREYPYYLEPRTGRPDGPPHDFVPESENCYGQWTWRGWRPFVLKPNTPTTCLVIYEVRVDATDLVFVASDLGDGPVGDTKTADLGLLPVPRHSIGQYVQVGDARWQVLSVRDLGHILESNGNREKTKERFIEVRFQVANKGSDSLDLDVVNDVRLRDKQGREHEHYLVPRLGLPDRYPEEFIPDVEECTSLELKPNIVTTCSGIYEVDSEATGIIFVASDLGGSDQGAEVVTMGLSDYAPVHLSLFEEDVEVGDMCWNVFSIEELGKELSNNGGDTATAEGRFLQTQFRLMNLGSETLRFEDALLIDDQKRVYEHYHIKRYLMPNRHPMEFIPDDEECFHIQLKPNAPKICTMIYDVAEDAENFSLLAGDLEGYETTLIYLPTAEQPNPCPVERGPIAPGGPYSVCKEVAPGVYRGEASENSPCIWVRMNGLKADLDSVIATRMHVSPFYVEILDSDASLKTECELVPLELVVHPVPLLTSVPPGMYLVEKDIGPGQYEGEPGEDLFCFWQRLNNFREEEDSTIEWDIPGETYVVEVAPSDYAVEFACHVELVKTPPGWQRIKDDRLGYSLAVPDGWHIIDLQRVEQHPLWGTVKRFFPDAAEGLKEFVDSPEGENVGYLALELDMFPRPSVKSIALVAIAPLADDMPPDIVIQLLSSVIQSVSMFPVDVQSLKSGTTNNLPSIQGVASADLSSQGLFEAHAVITALRANDTAYILVVVTQAKNAKAKQQQIDQIVSSFRPE